MHPIIRSALALALLCLLPLPTAAVAAAPPSDRVERPFRAGALIGAAVDGGELWASGFVERSGAGTRWRPVVLRRESGGAWQRFALPGPAEGMAEHNMAKVLALVPGGGAWALGDSDVPTGAQPCDVDLRTGGPLLAARLAGSRFVRTEVPVPARVEYGGFTGVSAVAADDAWASGTVAIVDSAEPRVVGGVRLCHVETHREAFVAHWDGTAWSRVDVPDTRSFVPLAVLALGPDEVWTAGYDAPSDTPRAYRWDGTTWTAADLPATGAHGEVGRLAVAPDGDLWAVGRTLATATAPGRALVLRWDGTRWSRIGTPRWSGRASGIAFRPAGPVVVGTQDSPGAPRDGAWAMRRTDRGWARVELPGVRGRLALADVRWSRGTGLVMVGNRVVDEAPVPVLVTSRAGGS